MKIRGEVIQETNIWPKFVEKGEEKLSNSEGKLF